jgi:hypothetical protein
MSDTSKCIYFWNTIGQRQEDVEDKGSSSVRRKIRDWLGKIVFSPDERETVIRKLWLKVYYLMNRVKDNKQTWSDILVIRKAR